MNPTRHVEIGSLARDKNGAFKIGPFGSSLKKSELSPNGIPVAGIDNVLANEFVKRFSRFIAEPKFVELADYEIRPGDVLVTTMGTIGRAAVAPDEVGRAIIDSHLFRMRVNESAVIPAYLCYAINSGLIRAQLKRLSRGSIMDGLNSAVLKQCTLPLPSIAEQRRIAAQLAEADRLRRMRRYSLALSAAFLPAAFTCLFGDPATNPCGWPTSTVGRQLSSSDYGTSQRSSDNGLGYVMLGMSNITSDGELDLSVVSRVELAPEEFQSLRL